MKPMFNPAIQGLRTVAVALVMAYHFGAPYVSGGFIGVDVFFVISGYLMATIITNTPQFSYRHFIISRVRRVFPALFVVIMAVLAAGYFTQLSDDYSRSTKHALMSALFISNHVFYGEAGYFDTLAAYKPLIHTWSLAVEAQFYLLLPLLLLFPLPLRQTARMSGLLVFSFAAAIYASTHAPSAAFYLLPFRLWEFFAGVLVASLAARSTPSPSLLFIGLGLILASAFSISAHMVFPGIAAFPAVLGAALVIYSRSQALLSNRLLVWIGAISYSLYLWHWPLVSLLKDALPISAIAALTFAAATLSYYAIERPFRTNSWWTHRRFLTACATAIVLLIAFTGLIKFTNGLPARLPDYIARAETARHMPARMKDCFRDADGSKKAKEEFCVIGTAKTTPSVILWGDSHANQLHMALDALLATQQKSGLIATSGGCVPSLGAEGTLPYGSEDFERIYPTCKQFNREVLALLEQSPQINTVIVAAQWVRYDSKLILADLATIHARFSKQGKRLIIVGAVPMPVVDVPRHWAHAQKDAGVALDTLPFPPVEAQLNAAKIWNGYLDEFAKTHANVQFINPFDALCDTFTCYMVKDGKAYFSDTAHLSIEGANTVLGMNKGK